MKLAVLLLVAVLAVPAAAQCPGDENRDNMVTVDELVRAVAAALTDCPDQRLAALIGTWRFSEDGTGFSYPYRFAEVDGDRILGFRDFGSSTRAIVVQFSGDPALPFTFIDRTEGGNCIRYVFAIEDEFHLIGSVTRGTNVEGRCVSGEPKAASARLVEG